MAEVREERMALTPDPLFGDVRDNWGWLLASGILMTILGFIGLGAMLALTLASVIFFGALALIGGVVQLIEAFKCRGWKGVLWHSLIGALYVVAGIVMIVSPMEASLVLTLALAIILVVVGIARIILAVQMRAYGGWVLPLIGGILSVILGVLIWIQWPVSGLWVIGLFVAIELIIHGWSNIFIALAARSARPAEA